MATHDIVVIGASAGGIAPLLELVRRLPASLPATLFVTLHFPSTGVSTLPQILSNAAGLPAVHAMNGEPIVPGRIYLAPPDRHLLLHPGHVTLTQVPHENGVRPAIDPMFRTAAATYGCRVVGVLLSGCLDDGTQGLAYVIENGGVAAVQEPREALFPEMPLNALEVLKIDQVLPVSGLADLVIALAHQPAAGGETMPRKRGLDIAEMNEEQLRGRAIDGRLTALSCPECTGSLWEVTAGITRYECRVGHSYSPKSLDDEQARSLEAQLWSLLRATEERRDLSRALARQASRRGLLRAASHYRRQLRQMEERAHQLDAILNGRAEQVSPG